MSMTRRSRTASPGFRPSRGASRSSVHTAATQSLLASRPDNVPLRPTTVSTANVTITNRASPVLEIKWKVKAGRSPNCVGPPCGLAPVVAQRSGATHFRCGACMRTLENAYMQAMQDLENQHEYDMKLVLAQSAKVRDLYAEISLREMAADAQSINMHQKHQELEAAFAHARQLSSQSNSLAMQKQELEELQQRTLGENSKLQALARDYADVLARAEATNRDLQHQNTMMRAENAKQQDQMTKLVETIDKQRQEMLALYESNAEMTRMNSRRWRVDLDKTLAQEKLKLQDIARSPSPQRQNSSYSSPNKLARYLDSPSKSPAQRQTELEDLDSRLQDAQARGTFFTGDFA